MSEEKPSKGVTDSPSGSRHRTAGAPLPEEDYRVLAESIPQLVWTTLPDGSSEYWNKRWTDYTGMTVDDKTAAWTLVHPDDATRCAAAWKAAFDAEKPYEIEYRLRRKDGLYRWHLALAHPTRARGGKIVRWIGTSTDIDDQKKREDRERFLAQTSALLGASLEYEETLASVVAAAVPHMADACTLEMLDGKGELSTTQVAVAHKDPAKVSLMRRFRKKYPVDPKEPYGTGQVIRSGKAEFFPSISPELIASTARDAEYAQLLREIGVASAITVPLTVRGVTLGTLSLTRDASSRPFDNEDVVCALDVARRAAISIDNARLYEAATHAKEEAQRARGEAERAERSLATTLRSIGDAVITTDAEGAVTFMNPVAETLTGWSEAEARGRPLRSVFHIVDGRTRKEVESPVVRVMREGAIGGLGNDTVLIARGRAVEVPIDDSGAPIRDENGVLVGVVLVFRDVGVKKREEEKRDFLAEATVVLSSSLDPTETLATVARLAVPRLADWCAVDIVEEGGIDWRQLAVAHVDPAKVVLASEMGKRYPTPRDAPTGVPNVLRTGKSEIYAEIPDDLLAKGAIDEEHLRILRALELRSIMIVPLLARGRTLGAMTFVFAESGRNYTSQDLAFAEELARRAAVAVDNTRLYETAERARRTADEANRMKDEFLSTISHELRTPLNAMLGWTRMLRSAELTDDTRARALETIERNAVAQAQLVDDLLDVARIISGKLRLSVQPVDMMHVIQATLDSLRLAIDARGIALQPLLDPVASPILGDATRLQQVVWNLLSNAIKFTPKGGKIRIVLERVDSQVALSVIDTGRGIPPEFLPHVFERFRQFDAKQSRSHGGLGLGLAIARHLVELHGGTIEASSKGEGEGATFTVRLPLSPVQSAAAEGSPAGVKRVDERRLVFDQAPVLQGLKVLIVEDEADSRDLLVLVLETCGAIVSSAATVKEGLATVEALRPDVIVSDIGLPDGDGYQFIEQVRRLPPERGGTIPAAAVTAYARAEDRRRALNAGYMMHVPKPVEPEELITVVANLARFRR